MNIIIPALLAALPFYISVIPIIILNIVFISEKRKILNIDFKLREKIITIGFILSIIFVLSITIGNCANFSFKNLKFSGINLIPGKELYTQYLFAIKGDIHSILNLFGNIIIFMPFGFFLSMYYKDDTKERFKVILNAIILSLIIEFLQLFIGRASDINDIILNTMGVFLGRCIFCYFNVIFEDFFSTINLKCINTDNNINVRKLSICQLFSVVAFMVFNLI